MNKCKRMGLWSSITCGFLAGVMGFTGPQEIKAAAQGAYLSDVIVISSKDVAKAKNDGYTVMSSPLGEQTLRDQKYGVDHTKTFLAYKTTTKVNEAIRDFKFMNMNGGFDFAKYDEYLDGLMARTKVTTNNLFVAIEGYRKFYHANTPEGLYAYEALNLLKYDEFDGLVKPDGVDGINMKLGDLFLDEELIPNGDSKPLTDIFMEANAHALDAIYSALCIANNYDDHGFNTLSKLNEIKNVYYLFADRTDLNAVFSTFDADFYRIREEVNWYNNEAVCKYTDFEDTDEALAYSFKLLEEDYINQTCYSDMWNNAAREIPFLSNIEYKGLSGNYNNLLDLIMDEDADPSEYYPLFACMPEGVRALSLLGIIDILTNALLNRDEYLERLNLLKETDEEANEIVESGISVFHGIDRSLYQKGNVAMTTSAQEGAAKGDAAWMQAQSDREAIDSQLTDILKYSAIGLGGIIVMEGVGYILARGVYSAALQTAQQAVRAAQEGAAAAAAMKITTSFGEGFTAIDNGVSVVYREVITESFGFLESSREVEVAASEVALRGPNCSAVVTANDSVLTARAEANAALESATSQLNAAKNAIFTLRVVMGVMVAVAVIALVVTLVFYFLNMKKDGKPVYQKYTEIPGILCHYQSVFDISDSGLRTPAKDKGYVYYYGARNPYSVVERAKYGNDDDGSYELGENKRNVQDIFNWELGSGKSREWLCLYYTKDARANYPITTSSFKLESTVGATVSGATLFNKVDIEYDINSILTSNYYDDEKIRNDVNKINEVAHKYLKYGVNKRANEGSRKTGSVVASATTWGLVLIGLALGFGGGFLTFHLIDKKKKKANA